VNFSEPGLQDGGAANGPDLLVRGPACRASRTEGSPRNPPITIFPVKAGLSHTPSFRSAAAKVNQRQVPTERSGPGNVAFVSVNGTSSHVRFVVVSG
jgi:hypothetical protein